MSSMNKRAKRITAACASAAVVTAGGVALGVTAGATGSLSLANATSFTTLDVGAGTSAAVASVQTLQASVAMTSGGDSVALTYGANSTTTLTAASTAAQIQTALNALASVTAAGGVTVTRTAGSDLTSTTTTYRITFNNTGVRTAISVVPATGTVAVNSTTGGNTVGAAGGNIAQALANTAFAAKVTTAGSTAHVVFDSYTAPSSGTPAGTPTLLVNKDVIANAIAPTTGWEGVTATNTSALAAASVANNVFVTANLPGMYKFRLVDDSGTPAATTDDVASDTMTMTVLDAEQATATTGDDWNPTVSAPNGVVQGVSVTATLSFAGLTTTDARGGNTTGGLLGGYVAALTGISFTGGGLGAVNNATAITYNGDGGYATATPTSAVNSPLVSTATFDANASGTPFTVAGDGFTSARTATTTVTDNLVTAFTSTATADVGKVLQTGSAVAVLAGQADVTYSATVTTPTSAVTSGKDFYFTLTKGTNSPALTADGTLVSSTTTSSVYKVTTDSSGVAKLKVTSGVTTAGTTYGVSVTTNGAPAVASTATYATAAAAALKITSTSAELAPAVGGKATIKGKLTDQLGAAYKPTGAGSLQVDVEKAGVVIGHANLTDGAFSYDYMPATAAAAGSSDTLTLRYGALSATAVVNWASTTSVNALTLTPATIIPNVATFNGGPGAAVTTLTGNVTDGSSAGLAFKRVTLTGDQGVYFASDALGTNLVNTMDVATNATGSYTAYVVYTRSGAAKITATSESKTATTTVTVGKPDDTQAYMVSVNNVAAMPNTTEIVTGKVVDIFGNPVAGVDGTTAADLTLTGDTVALGVLGAPSKTNDGGEYSATFIAGGTPGKVFLSAKIWAGVQKVPATSWLTVGGLTLPKSNSVATGNITIGANAVSLSADKTSLVGGGAVTLTGNTRPGAAVDVYMKVAGEGTQLVDSVTANSSGDFSVPVTVNKSASFFAKTATATSTAVSVKVISTAKISARAIRYGKIRVSVSGGPLKTGTIVLWQRFRGGKLVKLATYDTTTGGASWKLTPGKGTKIYRATYTSTGSDTSAVVSVSISL